jgi:hypothetical protein
MKCVFRAGGVRHAVVVCICRFLALFILRLKLGRYVPQKRWAAYEPHDDVATQKTMFHVVTAVRASDIT